MMFEVAQLQFYIVKLAAVRFGFNAILTRLNKQEHHLKINKAPGYFSSLLHLREIRRRAIYRNLYVARNCRWIGIECGGRELDPDAVSRLRFSFETRATINIFSHQEIDSWRAAWAYVNGEIYSVGGFISSV
jgi:hypothetical protein